MLTLPSRFRLVDSKIMTGRIKEIGIITQHRHDNIVTLGTTDPFTGQSLITLPVLTLAARNNRILNVTHDVWADAQKQATGQWQQLVK